MMENGRGLIKALENWAKKVTNGYKDVYVRDLSTSFRDGLAFCAIIHHYRPDLIDYDSLAKENIFENNSLAFSIAEKQLGVPALLDAEDMVKYSQPDRLSIITYLSQLRNCFENQNKVNKKPELKRIQQNSSGPPAKVPVLPSLSSAKRHEVCQVCKHRVFILERLMVDGKLYHTTCFRCHKCDALLNPGAYVESDTPGFYECSVCLKDEAPESTESSMDISEVSEEPKADEPDTQAADPHPPSPVVMPEKNFTSKEAVNFAKSNLSQDSSIAEKSNLLMNSLKTSNSFNSEAKHVVRDRSETGISIKDKINVFERNRTPEKSPSPAVTPVPKPRHSLLSINKTDGEKSPTLNKFSVRQPLASPKSPQIFFDGSEKNDLSSPSSFLAKDFNQKEKSPTQFESNINGKELLDSEMEKTNNACDSKSNSANSLSKISDSVVKSSASPLKDLNSDTRNIFSIKSDSDSPGKTRRDIFKSSMPPLKLSLPSTIRREPSSAPESKTFNIPQIKSNYSSTLPRPVMGRSLSAMKPPADSAISSSESSLNSSVKLQKDDRIVRRSSLESGKEDKTSLETDTKSVLRANSFYEMNSKTDNQYPEETPKSYKSVYKSIYSSPSLTNSKLISKLDSNNSDITSKNTSNVENFSEKISLTKASSSSDSEKNSDVSSEVTSRKEVEVINLDKKVGIKIIPPDSLALETDTKEVQKEDYPDDLNPFDDDEGGENEEDYPDDLNPFGDDEEEGAAMNSSKISVDDYDESKNPFASDDDNEEETDTSKNTTCTPKPQLYESKASNLQDSICSNVSSPSGSLKGTLKKRQAPRPPKVSDIFPKDSADSGIDSSFSSVRSSPTISKKNFQASSPKVRKNKPAPPPPPSPSVQDSAASVKMTKETDNIKLKSSLQPSEQLSSKQPKKKKRPAPPVPIPMRRDMKKIPLKEIVREMKEIEEKQREFERQGREIELLIRDRDKDEEPSVEEEEYIMQLFELVNQKNALFRRQAELMYIKRSQRLEEQQYQVEKEIRLLMEKPESEKTDEDRQKEEELTMELIDIVDQRNSIIDSIEMDRRRELEEDHSVKEQLDMKNGDLPITAEIKQKSGKLKKKAKKEKKKAAAEESGKGTLKKRKNLFSKRS